MALIKDRKYVIPSITKSRLESIHKQHNLIALFNDIYYPDDNSIFVNKPYIPTINNNTFFIQEKKAEALKKSLYDSIGWELKFDKNSNRYYFKHPYSTIEYPVGWKYFGPYKVMIPQYISQSDSHECSTNKKPNDKYSLPWYFSELTYNYQGHIHDFSDFNKTRRGKRALKKIKYFNKRYERNKLFENTIN